MRSRLPIVAVSILFALLTLLPYLLAYAFAGDSRFTGFLFNPYDGASYLAKMRQGFEGQWLYTLAFTGNPGPGALLFSFYLLLGHIARLLSMPLMAVWQAARVTGCFAFLVIAWEFFGRLGFTTRVRSLAWIITALGSGFGWIAAVFGTRTADLWVAEYNPFLGMLTNAHFPIAMGLILLLTIRIALPSRKPSVLSHWITFLLALALGALQPFGILPIGLALALWIIVRRFADGRFPEGAIPGLFAAGMGVLPWAVYDIWAIQSSPQLASWFAQNQTPTPPIWDIALSLGLPGLVCAIALVRWILAPGGFAAKVRTAAPGTLLLAFWVLVNFALLYAPFALQRRLMLGMWLPLAALAAHLLAGWVCRPAPAIRRVMAAALLLPVSLIVLLAVGAGVLQHNPLLFLSRDEAAAVDWLDAHGQGAVVLAPPEIGLWLPGMADVRVLYGHPMETPDAAAALDGVQRFFQGEAPAEAMAYLSGHEIRYLLISPREPLCSCRLKSLPLEAVARFGGVVVYTVDAEAGNSK